MSAAAVLDRRPRGPLDGSRWTPDRPRDGGRGPNDSIARAPLFEVEAHGARTLDELITDTWESLMARKLVHCPACHGKMEARAALSGGIEGGECADCGVLLI